LEFRRTWWRDRNDISSMQKLDEFIEDVLLASIPGNIVIFIDEIDSTLSLKFAREDFFALIRSCYNRRSENSAYKRLTFALLGVATPSDLIKDKTRTPFNIGEAIELDGFKIHEIEPLAKGLGSFEECDRVLFWRLRIAFCFGDMRSRFGSVEECDCLLGVLRSAIAFIRVDESAIAFWFLKSAIAFW
jgi:AAA-like domain